MSRRLVLLIGLLLTASACSVETSPAGSSPGRVTPGVDSVETSPAGSSPGGITPGVESVETSPAESSPGRVPPCVESVETSPVESTGTRTLADGSEIPPAPSVPTGPLDATVIADLDSVFATLRGGFDLEALSRIGESGDARLAWLMSDLLRFFQRGDVADGALTAFERLTGTTITAGFAWGAVTDLLIAWDLPAPPGYVDWKRIPFEIIEPAWEPFFGDEDAAIDFRLLSWGGVLIDDRPVDEVELPCLRGCIPALNDPKVTDAAGGSWLPDERLVFGVVVDGEARAYPKHQMEVHEMINDTLGGRRIGLPYCTLCGSAQAYFTDVVPDGFETIELRTSGLLSRSNKVMFDLHTFSVFDTFLGNALSGPLQDEGFVLEMVTVITSTWGEWKSAHPDTTIVAEDGGLGRNYSLNPLGGRDDAGPIFPVGAVDTRLPVQEQVVGVVTPDGTAVAFPVTLARATLDAGGEVNLAGARVVADGGGLRVEWKDCTELVSHQSFWFAWSQFQQDTLVWTPLS